MTKTNNDYIGDEDINILIEQGNISRDRAKELLKKYHGDIVECLVNMNNVNKPEIKREDDEILPVSLEKENINKYRKIINEKENIYSYISGEKEKKKKEKERHKLISENKSTDHLDTPKLNNEDLYYLNTKGNFTSIKIL